MKVKQVKKLDDVVTLDATASVQDVARVLQMAHEGFARSMGLQPEKGKTVAQVAEEKMGIRNLDQIVAQSAAEMLVPMALDKRNLIPAFRPTAVAKGELRRGSEYRFTMDVTMRPVYELSSYEPVEVEAPEFKVDESAVRSELDAILNEYTAYVKDEDADPDHELASGDYVKINMTATGPDGKEFRGLNAKGRTYAVGAGHMPEGFDSQLRGMRVGEKKSFTFEAPSFDDDFNETTTSVDAEVEIAELLKASAPALDDVWIQKNMPWFKNASELEQSVRKSVEIANRESYDAFIRQKVAEEWAKRFEGKISDEAYEAMSSQLLDSLRMDVQQTGKPWDEFVKESGGEDQIRMALMLQSRDVLAQGYALDAIFRHFGLVVTDADIEAVCHSMNPQANPKELRRQIEQNGQGFALRESAERYKANIFAVENAVINHVS